MLHFLDYKLLVYFENSILGRSQPFKRSQSKTQFGQFATRNSNYWIKKKINVAAALTDEIRYCNLTPNFPTIL